MDMEQLMQVAGWSAGLMMSAGLQIWWWTGGGPGWLPILTGPALVAATLGINGAARRRSDPEFAARTALEREAVEQRTLGLGGLFGVRQG